MWKSFGIKPAESSLDEGEPIFDYLLETFVRMGLKAQSQCRATWQAVAELQRAGRIVVEQDDDADKSKPPPRVLGSV